jgi:transposase
MWTPEHRVAARPQDLRMRFGGADDQPERCGGRPWDVNVCEVINGLLYLLRIGCQWQALHFKRWDWDGTLERNHHALYVVVREQAGREANPSAAIIDGQSAKTAQKGVSMDPQG